MVTVDIFAGRRQRQPRQWHRRMPSINSINRSDTPIRSVCSVHRVYRPSVGKLRWNKIDSVAVKQQEQAMELQDQSVSVVAKRRTLAWSTYRNRARINYIYKIERERQRKGDESSRKPQSNRNIRIAGVNVIYFLLIQIASPMIAHPECVVCVVAAVIAANCVVQSSSRLPEWSDRHELPR